MSYEFGLSNYLIFELNGMSSMEEISNLEEKAFTVGDSTLDELSRIKREIIKIKSLFAFDYGENCNAYENKSISAFINLLEDKVNELSDSNLNLVSLSDKTRDTFRDLKKIIVSLDLIMGIQVSFKRTLVALSGEIFSEIDFHKLFDNLKNFDDKSFVEEDYINNVKYVDDKIKDLIIKNIIKDNASFTSNIELGEKNGFNK